MDPKETFSSIVDYIETIINNDPDVDIEGERENLVTTLEDFTEWIKKGGFIPEDILSCIKD